jgi:hypothetical protein
MKSVGTRTKSAMPIQKREKRSAVMKERASVPSAKARNTATGVKERRVCIRTKVCNHWRMVNKSIFAAGVEGEWAGIRIKLAGLERRL